MDTKQIQQVEGGKCLEVIPFSVFRWTVAIVEKNDFKTILTLFSKLLILSCDNIATFLRNVQINPGTYHTILSKSIQMSKNTSLHIPEPSFAGWIQFSHFPNSTLMLLTQPWISHTATHRRLDKELCRWQGRYTQSCQLAEVPTSDKRKPLLRAQWDHCTGQN